mmetsp:Transcript_22084/g.52559  ORF Transcript_22084/g.52559 Transcript_22084/m.52559 type:complete len:108 (+) Transcript_22084:209-532(+)
MMKSTAGPQYGIGWSPSGKSMRAKNILNLFDYWRNIATTIVGTYLGKAISPLFSNRHQTSLFAPWLDFCPQAIFSMVLRIELSFAHNIFDITPSLFIRKSQTFAMSF